MHRAVLATLTALLLAVGMPVTPALAASSAKVVVVVGPVGDHTAHYKDDANEIVTEARKYTSNVVKIFTPGATWSKVRAAAQGASVFVYLGHGNGWPSIYAPFQTQTKDGLGLDPSTGADSTKTVYYGEDYIRGSIRLAPNAVVLLYHLCYASGNTEPGFDQGTFAQARERVDNYGAGFIGAGARAVFAEGHPAHPVVSTIRQLFTTNRSMETIFRSAPTWHGHLQGPYASQRTPGLEYEMDPDSGNPSGFYRSLVGDLSMTASRVTGTLPVDTGTHPPDFVVPGAAEVTAGSGVPLFGSADAAADPTSTAGTILPVASRLRVTGEAAPAADGTRILAVTVLGATTSGFVRATGLAPRDSADVALLTFDTSPAWLSPNGDGVNDELVLAQRFSERVTATYVVKNSAGTTVRTGQLVDTVTRFGWDLRDPSGAVVHDGTYTWAFAGRDAWGNGRIYRTGTFTVDGTPPVTTATPDYTTGSNGWITSPVDVTLVAKDSLSGVRAVYWRMDGGTAKTYVDVARVTANGTRSFEYRAIDKSGVREGWKKVTFKIDTRGPIITPAFAGDAGDTPGTWRGPVTITPSFSDATSGVGPKSTSVDGGPVTTLSGPSIVVKGDGAHSVTIAARDLAGNRTAVTVELVIDTTPPVVEIPAAADGAAPLTVTPNADGRTETLAIAYTVSEPATVTGVVAAADGTVVRTLSAPVAAGEHQLSWDGRTAAGKAVTDGTYSITLTPTDPAGNTGDPASTTVDVYAALASIARTPVRFFPQDGDALATKTQLTYTLRSPAAVTVDVRNAAGDVVRTGYTDRAMPVGLSAWNWNGKLADGTFAPRGAYRIVVHATNGTQAASQAVSVFADAFQLRASVATTVRGTTFTLTATTSEALSTAPVVVVKEPGLTARTVTMTKASSTTWTAKITPRTTATPGTLGLTVKAKDSAGGTNSSILRLALQ